MANTVRITDQLYVAAGEIVSLTVDSTGQRVEVRLRGGIYHRVPAEHGQTGYERLRELITDIERPS